MGVDKKIFAFFKDTIRSIREPMSIHVFLLEDWHNFIKEQTLSGFGSNQGETITCFLSFLNLESLLLAKCIFQQNMSHAMYTCKKNISLVFFPISRVPLINKRFVESFIALCKKGYKREDELYFFISSASKIVSSNYREYLIKKTTFDGKHTLKEKNKLQTRSSNPSNIYEENAFLFGDLTAKYLERIHIFPYCIEKGRYYEGIPQNMNVEEFLSLILL